MFVLTSKKCGRSRPIEYLAISVVSWLTTAPNEKNPMCLYVLITQVGTSQLHMRSFNFELLDWLTLDLMTSVTVIYVCEELMDVRFKTHILHYVVTTPQRKVLTSTMGSSTPTTYSIQFRIVDSWKGCLRDSSSQKNPLWYGSPQTKNARIGMPTAIMNRERKKGNK